jgi:hypothetical protein
MTMVLLITTWSLNSPCYFSNSVTPSSSLTDKNLPVFTSLVKTPAICDSVGQSNTSSLPKFTCTLKNWASSLYVLFFLLQLGGANKSIRRSVLLIWHSVLWAIWGHRNASIFSNKSINKDELFKLVSYVLEVIFGKSIF